MPILRDPARAATPLTIAPYRPFYVRDATAHCDIPGRFATLEEAAAERDHLRGLSINAGRLFIVKKKGQA